MRSYIILFAALALLGDTTAFASSCATNYATEIAACQATLVECVDNSTGSTKKRASGTNCGCEQTTGEDTDCTCQCACINSYFSCYYALCNDWSAAASSISSDVLSDYTSGDCTTANSSAPKCYFQLYGDPHMTKSTGKSIVDTECRTQTTFDLYESSTLSVTATASTGTGSSSKAKTSSVTFTRSVSFTISSTTYTISSSSFAFSPSTAPSKYVFGSCNSSITMTTSTKTKAKTNVNCLAMYAPSGEWLAVFATSDNMGGNYLAVEIFGYCDGSGNAQTSTCPSSRRHEEAVIAPSRHATRTSTACTGLSGSFLTSCEFDVAETGEEDAAASAQLASTQAARATSIFTAMSATSAVLSAGAIAGIVIGGAAGVTLAASAVAGGVYVAKKNRSSEPEPERAAVEVSKKPVGAGPNVMNPNPNQHVSLTARAPPVEA